MLAKLMINAFSSQRFSLKYVRWDMQNAPLGLVIPAGAFFFEKEFMMLLLFHPAAYYIPINDTPKSVYMIGAAILIIEIVGVFPNIKA